MFGLTAVMELFVLRHCYGRWSFPRCIISVVVFSGIVCLIGWMLMDQGDEASKMEPPFGYDWMWLGLYVLISLLTFMVIALLPAGMAAIIYRKLGIHKKTHSLPKGGF